MKRLVVIIINIIVSIEVNAQTDGFPYPEIPSMLATPSERGAYLLEHYWDNYDFADTTLIDQQDISEQGFANFIDLLPRLDSTAAVKGIEIFGKKAFGKGAERKVADRFESMTEHYLADPNSPMRNEELYILFLEAQIAAMDKDGFSSSRPKARMNNAKKNRPGTKASDIAFTTSTGLRTTLYETDAPLLLLIFYDPACEHCSEILKILQADEEFSAQVKNGEVKVLAVYTEGDRQLWNSTCGNMPKDWTVAIDESNIVANNIYDIPAMPVLYLLDKDKRVIMKDPSVGDFLLWIKINKQQ